MLRRQRQINMQIQQLLDALIFAVSFWWAWQLRASTQVMDAFNLVAVEPFEAYFLLYIVLIPGAPLVLEAQGFYDRPSFTPRRTTMWLLFKGCCFTTMGLIIATFFL